MLITKGHVHLVENEASNLKLKASIQYVVFQSSRYFMLAWLKFNALKIFPS